MYEFEPPSFIRQKLRKWVYLHTEDIDKDWLFKCEWNRKKKEIIKKYYEKISFV